MTEIEQGISDLLDSHNAWRDVAQFATPGGSEYTTPEACRAHIRIIKTELHYARCEVVRLKRLMKPKETE